MNTLYLVINCSNSVTSKECIVAALLLVAHAAGWVQIKLLPTLTRLRKRESVFLRKRCQGNQLYAPPLWVFPYAPISEFQKIQKRIIPIFNINFRHIPLSLDLLYLCIVSTFLVVKLAGILAQPIDPFKPLDYVVDLATGSKLSILYWYF